MFRGFSRILRAIEQASLSFANRIVYGDSYNQIYDPEKSWITESECVVHLGYRIRNSDALVVSRLAFDPVANRNAKRIVVDTIAATVAGQPYSVTCFPPFEATSDLRVRGRYVDGRSRFLVYEILKCTGPFPAGTVRSDRPGRAGAASGGKRAISRAERAADREAKMDEASDPTSRVLPEEVDLVAKPIFAARLADAMENAEESSASVVRTTVSDTFSVGEEQQIGQLPMELVPAEDDDELFVLEGRRARVQTDEVFIGTLKVLPGSQRLWVEQGDDKIVPIDLRRLRSLEILDPSDLI